MEENGKIYYEVHQPSWDLLDELLLSHNLYFALNLSVRNQYSTDGGIVTMNIGKFLEKFIGEVDDTKPLPEFQTKWLNFMKNKDAKSKAQMSSRKIVIGSNGLRGFNREIIFSICLLADPEVNTLIEECALDVSISLYLEQYAIDVVNVALQEAILESKSLEKENEVKKKGYKNSGHG